MTAAHEPVIVLGERPYALLLDLLDAHPDLQAELRAAAPEHAGSVRLPPRLYQQAMDVLRAVPYAELAQQTETHLVRLARQQVPDLLHGLGMVPDAPSGPGRTLFIDYSATGEGRHIWWLWTPEEDPEAAREQFRARFFPDGKSWDYFILGLEEVRGRYVLPGMTREKVIDHAYESHVNRS